MEYVFSICVKFELFSNNGILNIYNRIEKEERLRKREVEDDILLKEQRARSLELDKSVTIQKVSSTMSTVVCSIVCIFIIVWSYFISKILHYFSYICIYLVVHPGMKCGWNELDFSYTFKNKNPETPLEILGYISD